MVHLVGERGWLGHVLEVWGAGKELIFSRGGCLVHSVGGR